MTEDQLEQEALGWLASVGYTPLNARDPDLDPRLVRASSRDVVLVPCLRAAIDRLNPAVPAAARDDAFRQVLDMGQPALLSGNRAFHRVLVTGVPVQYQKDGETRGDFVRLIDWQDTARNEWLAVQQFTIKGPHHTRRPDIILFVNGLPLVLLAPVLGLQFDLTEEALWTLTIGLLLGTPVLSLIGAVGAALTLGVRGGDVLLSLLILPLYVPALIFGAGAVQAQMSGLGAAAHLSILAAMALVAAVFSPWVSAASLRIALES